MAEPFDFAGAARELVGCLLDCDDAICRDARARAEKKLRDAHAAGALLVAAEAVRHAEFLEREARHGGNAPYLRARAEEAHYLAGWAAQQAER